MSFDLSKSKNKYYHSKWRKAINHGNMTYLNDVLQDSINKITKKYTPKYYSCCKFIRDVTSHKFKKIKHNIYLIRTYNDDFTDVCVTDDFKKCTCINKNKNLTISDDMSCGKYIGTCKYGCCFFYKKQDKFDIKWL